MKTVAHRVFLTTVVMISLFAVGAAAQTEEFLFYWPPSPIEDGNGVVRPEAVFYEVWFQRGDDAEVLIGTTAVPRFIVQGEPDIEQRIRVRAVDAQGRQSEMSEWSDPIFFTYDDGVVPNVPTGPELAPNYPNPFNPETTIVYAVPEDISSGTRVRLEIFSVNGQRVRRFEVDRTPGWHQVTWNGRDDNGMIAATGMYVTMLAIGEDVVTNKMTMLK